MPLKPYCENSKSRSPSLDSIPEALFAGLNKINKSIQTRAVRSKDTTAGDQAIKELVEKSTF